MSGAYCQIKPLTEGRGGLVVNTSDYGSRSRGFESPSGSHVVYLSKTYLPPPTPHKVLVIPGKRWLHPNIFEKMFTGMLSINQAKTAD